MVQRRDLRVVRSTSVLDELPDVLTVEEAARFLRIGRGAAYELARQWRASNGRDGLPVVTFGRTLRVPKSSLARLLDPDSSTAAGQ